MKKILFASVFLLMLLSFPLCANCDMADSLGISELEEQLPQEVSELLGEVDIINLEPAALLEKLKSAALDRLSELKGEVLRPVLSVLITVLLCSASAALMPGRGFDYVNLTSCLAIAAVCIGDVNSVLSMGRSAMEELSLFSKALLPTLAVSAAAAGAVSTASAMYAASLMFLDLLISAANELIFPLICAYMALALASAALGDGRLNSAGKLLAWFCKISLTALVSAFTLYMSLSGIAASSSDAFAAKTAKTVLAAALPVVGKIVSDAAGSIVAGAGVIKASVGVFGLIAVMALCLTPFLRIGLRYLLLKAAAAIAQGMAGERSAKLIDNVGTAYGMVLAIVGVEAIFVYISVISILKAVLH